MGPFDDFARISSDPIGFSQSLLTQDRTRALDFDKKALAPAFGFTPIVDLPDFKPETSQVPDVAPFQLPALFGGGAAAGTTTAAPTTAIASLPTGGGSLSSLPPSLLSILGLSNPGQAQPTSPSLASQGLFQSGPYTIFNNQPIITSLPSLMNFGGKQTGPLMPALYNLPFGSSPLMGQSQAMSSPFAGLAQQQPSSSFYNVVFNSAGQPVMASVVPQPIAAQTPSYLSLLAGAQGLGGGLMPISMGANAGLDLLSLLTGTPATAATNPTAATAAPGETNVNNFLQSLLTAPALNVTGADPASATTATTAPGETNINNFLQSLLTAPATATPDPATATPAAPAPVVTPAADPAKPRVRLEGDKIITGLSFLDNQASDSKTVSINANDLLKFTTGATGKPFDITTELTRAKLTPEQIKAATDELAGQTVSFSGRQVVTGDGTNK